MEIKNSDLGYNRSISGSFSLLFLTIDWSHGKFQLERFKQSIQGR